MVDKQASSSVTLNIPDDVLSDVDSLAADMQKQAPGRIVKRSEVLRDVLIVGIRERKRKRGTVRGETRAESPKTKRGE
jgi:metal-responsive CopG/Arc/MetJ family transcriptional regulator